MKAETKTVEALTSQVYDSLRYGQFDALRLIKAADSSQSSCMNWQALELLRSLLFKEQQKQQKSFLVSRSTIQRTQNALEAASDEIAPVKVDVEGAKFNVSLILLCSCTKNTITTDIYVVDGSVSMDIRKAIEELLVRYQHIEIRGLSEDDYHCEEIRAKAEETVIGGKVDKSNSLYKK